MENQLPARKWTIRELLHQASVEQDRDKLSDLIKNVFLAIDRGESANDSRL